MNILPSFCQVAKFAKLLEGALPGLNVNYIVVTLTIYKEIQRIGPFLPLKDKGTYTLKTWQTWQTWQIWQRSNN